MIWGVKGNPPRHVKCLLEMVYLVSTIRVYANSGRMPVKADEIHRDSTMAYIKANNDAMHGEHVV